MGQIQGIGARGEEDSEPNWCGRVLGGICRNPGCYPPVCRAAKVAERVGGVASQAFRVNLRAKQLRPNSIPGRTLVSKMCRTSFPCSV